jgi:hypothetical protein
MAIATKFLENQKQKEKHGAIRATTYTLESARLLAGGTDKLTFHWQKTLLTAFVIRSLPFPKTQRRRTLTPDKGGNKSDGAQD